MAITERIGFETADAIANLNALNAAIIQVNSSIGQLNRTVGRSGGVNNAAQGFTNVANSAGRARTAVAGTTTSMRTAGQVGTRAGQSLTLSWQTFGRVILTQGIVRGLNAITQALAEAARTSAEFEITTARIANITDEGAAGVDQLRESFRQLAIDTGRSLEEVTEAGLEALQNDLGTTQETFELLSGSANDLSRATGSTLVSAINSVSSVLRSYNRDIADSVDIADAFFVAYDKGRITLEELESRLGTVAPQAATLGIAFEDSAAAVASLTLSGLNSQTAMTQLRNVLARLIKPTEELELAFERLGVSSGEELIREFGGLQGALSALRDSFQAGPQTLREFQDSLIGVESGAQNSEQALARAFGTIRGQLGVLNLLANEGTNFTGVLEAMDDRLGRVAEAADAVNETTTQQLREEVAQLNDNLIPVGNAINTLKLNTASFINDFIEGFQRLQQREDFQRLAQLANNFGTAFISVIDDIIAKLDSFLRGLGRAAAAVADIISRITNPVGTTEGDRIDQIRQDMERLRGDAAAAADDIRQSFQQRGDTSILGDQQEAFDQLAALEQQAQITSSNLRAQFLANEARIRANTDAAEGFRRSLEAATAAPLFGNTEQLQQTNAQLREISAALLEIEQRSATASGTEATQLQKELELQQRKIQSKSEELGIDDKAVQALIGQANATQQVLANQQGKAENEERAAQAAELANQALAQQQAIAQQAGVSMQQLGISGTQAGEAIAAIPDPQVNASAAIAQMNALRAAAIAAAQAVAAANSGGGGGFFHGGVVHRQSGGGIGRGQDTVPAMLSPGEFVMNRRSSSRFFSQLQAMNAGQSPSFRDTGGPVTNIGDINVNVSGGSGSENPDQVARQIASGLRRELRRKTSRI